MYSPLPQKAIKLLTTELPFEACKIIEENQWYFVKSRDGKK